MDDKKQNEVKNKTDDISKKICEQVDKKLELLTKEGIQQANIDYIGKLVDIKKDIAEINHKRLEDDNMMYRGYEGYGNYGNYDNYHGRMRDSQGRFMDSGNYGNRGYDNRYQGDKMVDDVAMNYGDYVRGRERYGAEEGMKALNYMLRSLEDFGMYLIEDAKTEEEKNMIRQTLRKMANK